LRSEFERLRSTIERALPYAGGTHSIEDVWDAIANGTLQLWPGKVSAIVTQVIQYPRSKELVFFLAAGDLEEIQRVYDVILDWGKAQGCERATFMGRKGWERTFLTKEEGWRSGLVAFEKEL